MRILIASDFHSGHLLGLTPPPHHYPYQETLWSYYVDAVQDNGPYDAAIFNGDLIDGPGKKETTHHLTTDTRKQVKMAIQAIEAAQAPTNFIVKGTGFHTDTDGNDEEFIGDAVGCSVQDELRLEIHGRKLHARHVVGRSDIPYGQYTQLGKELINDLLQAEFEGYEDADILIRSHVHYCVRIGVADGIRGVMREAITTPALQLRGPLQSGFTRKLRTWLYHVGITVINIEPGRLDIRPVILPITTYQRREYTCLT